MLVLQLFIGCVRVNDRSRPSQHILITTIAQCRLLRFVHYHELDLYSTISLVIILLLAQIFLADLVL